MKKFIKVTIVATALTIALCSCGGVENTVTEGDVSTETAQKADNMKEYSINECSFMAPGDMVESESATGEIVLESKNYKKDGFKISGYGVGHTTYVNDPLKKTYEEWNTSKEETGVKIEKISYDYKDGEKFEEVSHIVKYEYLKGSSHYDIAELGSYFEDDEKLPDKIVVYEGHKTIVNKADKSQAIELSVTSKTDEHIDTMQKVLNSLNWAK